MTGHSSSNSKQKSNSKCLKISITIPNHTSHFPHSRLSKIYTSKQKQSKKSFAKMANFHRHQIMNVLRFRLLASAILLSLSLFLTLFFLHFSLPHFPPPPPYKSPFSLSLSLSLSHSRSRFFFLRNNQFSMYLSLHELTS